MITPLLLSLCLSSAPPAIPLQEDETVIEDKREEVESLLDQLGAHTKKRGEEDEAAITIVDQLYQEFPRSGPKDRKAIVKALEGCLKLKRTKELEPGVPDDRLYLACAVAMKDMAPESVKPLIGLIGQRNLKKNLPVQRRLILSLGKTRDPAAVKTLTGLLDHHEATLQGASAEALGEFGELDQKVRKDVFDEMLQLLLDQKTKVDTDPTDIEAYERLNTISGPIIASLQRLSGHDERDPQAWLRWWNDNKKEDWDEERD